MIQFAGLVLCVMIVATGLATAISHLLPNWPARRTAYVAAAPLPMALAGFCIWLFVDAATSSKEECGVDACGMAMAFSLVGLGCALVGFVIGAISATFVKRLADRP